MNTGSRTVDSQTAPASFHVAESKPNKIDLIKRLEEELARSRVREEALISFLKTKAEGSSAIESKEQPPSFQFHHPFPCREMRAPPGFINPNPIVHLQQLQLQKFTGDIKRFPIFVQEFKAFVESQCFDDYRRLFYLQMHLVGEPANLIQSCPAHPNKSEVYSRAWELLNDRYGNRFRLRNKVREELVSGPLLRTLIPFN